MAVTLNANTSTGFIATSDTSGVLQLQTGGTTAVTVDASQNVTLANGASIQGLTVGRGAGAVSTNTAMGASALASGSLSGGSNTGIGNFALTANTTGANNTAVANGAMEANTTGIENSAFGSRALRFNTIGNYNSAFGRDALFSNTTASNNTAVGYQAGYTNSTGQYNTFVGFKAGYTSNTGNDLGNTCIGSSAGYSLTTGTFNTFIGSAYGAGYYVTTGSKNTIIGGYTGNQGGLDIRTANNYIVLSDGDGNPRYWFNGTTTNNYLGNTVSVINEYRSTTDGLIGAFTIGASYDAASVGDMMIKKYTQTGYTSPRIYIVSSTNGVYLAVNGTSWASASDERMKDIIEPITDAANKVSTLRAVIGKYKTDEEGTRRSFLIAQDIQAVLPEAVDATDSEKLGVQYTDVIPLLVAAIKELKAEIDILKGQA